MFVDWHQDLSEGEDGPRLWDAASPALDSDAGGWWVLPALGQALLHFYPPVYEPGCPT